ncbi:probable methyltransferase TARBP1 isoform X2 [Temnothorax longispinosus]|uniref:probable methyltransferase TARBP1 isoform X2 n=1 Tax=Temnothorax longispinosus TaxID=300112 RepID=UPI003A999AE4
MDLHNRYLHFSTVNISLLQTIDSKYKLDVHHLIQCYNQEITTEELNMDKLELCRLLLCYEYQSAFHDVQSGDRKKYVIPADAEKLSFPNIKMIFPPNYSRNASQISLLCDIIILQMILYHNASSIKQHLQYFFCLSKAYIATSESRIMYMKILEYLLEFLRLYELHATSEEIKALKNLSCMYLDIIKSWVKVKKDNEWRLFALMFPKLVEIFTPTYIVYPLWDLFLHEASDLKESLTVLSIMADTCLTSSHSMNILHRDIYCKSTFWLFVLKGLRSPVQQYHKQALYIMKKAIDSLNEEVVLKLARPNLTKAQITPFICYRSGTFSSMDHIKKRFFLVYEAVEEKQEHLVTPALTHIADLIKVNEEHRACDCFNIEWLQCIFEKVLLHENNRIAKWGVSHVCKLDDTIFNDQFLELFVNVLNNNFLYECQPDEECPDIVKELSHFLKCAEKSDLLNRFLKKVSCVAWGPVAIFYIIHALRTISQKEIQHSNWQTTELNAIKSLVETNLSMHSHILRTASQIELLRAIPNYVRQMSDLPLLANVLATFPPGEGLTRGTIVWNIITAWLQKLLAKKDVETFVKETCEKYSQVSFLIENASLESRRIFALIVYLLYDANLIFSCKLCPAAASLSNWLCTLNGIVLRPYADIISSIYIVEFMSHLLHLSVKGPLDKMTDFITLYIRTTFNFLIKYMRKMSTELTYEDYTRYTAILSSHIVNAPLFIPKKDANVYIETLRNESMNLIDNLQSLNLQYLYGLYVLYVSQNALALPCPKTFYTKHLLTMRELTNISKDINANLKGKITSEYYLLLLKLHHQYLVNSPVSSWIPVTTMLSNLLQFLEIGLLENISEIAKILTVIVDNKVISEIIDRKTLECAFDLGFTCIINSKKNNIFWTAVEDLMGIIINNNFFLLPNAVLNAAEFVNQYIAELLNCKGENTRFKRIILSKMKNLDIHNLIKLENPLENCLFHGSPYLRNKKIENHAHLFIVKHLGQYYPKHIFTLDYNNDAAIRAEAVILLQRIINSELNYAPTLVQLILDALEKNKTKRYFNDSSLHKLKHRTMQILLILEPMLDEEFVSLLQEKLCNFIFSESNQSSVRIMQEWLLIRIFTKNIHLHDTLWSLFAKSLKHRPRCTISVASIVYHVAKLLSSTYQKVFIRTALPYIVQCCLGQQFNVRVYNQFILTQLYELIKATYGDRNLPDYKGIYQAAVIGLQQESLTKNSFRIQDDFYFSKFHPINDYSLQTIYYELPRLTNVSCDEWISPDVFKDLMFEQSDAHPLQLYNANSFLTETESSVYLTKSFAGDAHAELLENNGETYMDLNNIQKKIEPSKPTDLRGDIFEMTSEFISLQDAQLQEGLIVVASFVDRPPNLGGIARTCEIFGVKTLVIANADCVKDREFQFLSVSADKWLNMLQVKPHELQKFLLDRKNVGWSLIGVEQTVNSINLMTTQFEKKTILILGNEKDGIPANFIPLFDKCIEIPQVGVTRSLNVHVTAAICIWQYASQHVLK